MKMGEGKIKIRDIATLRQEKKRLQILCRDMERQLDERFDHLKENYAAMTFNSVFQGTDSKSTVWKWLRILARIAWKTEKLRPALSGGLIGVVEFIAARYWLKIFRRFFGKAAGK